MKYLLLTPLFSLASATCYQSGAPWPDNHAGMVGHIKATAKHFANKGQVKLGEHVHNVNYDGTCLHFVLENISDGHRSITEHEAEHGFLKEFKGCHYGGDTNYTNWRFVGNPNESC